ncbi:MAG TPA: hypothetical protein VII52_03405, partial [Gemmatimonadaceae bacterium]
MMSDNPLLDQRAIIEKGQVARIELCCSTDCGQFHAELNVSARHIRRTADSVTFAAGTKPVPHCCNRAANIVVMGPNVLSADVRTEYLIPVLIAVQNQTRLARLDSTSEALGAKEYPQLEGHVKPGQAVLSIERDARKVVNAIT